MPIAPATSVVTTNSNKLKLAIGVVMIVFVGFGFYSSVSNENLVSIDVLSERNSSIVGSQVIYFIAISCFFFDHYRIFVLSAIAIASKSRCRS